MWNSADLLKTINFKLVLMFSIASKYLPDIVLQKCTQTYFKGYTIILLFFSIIIFLLSV